MKKFLFFLFFCCFIMLLQAERLYWVGGFGSFNDPTHWSLTSGGKGGAKIPDSGDDVFFDRNSSLHTSVIRIIGEAQANDFHVAEKMNRIIFEGSTSSQLHVFGNLNLRGNIDWNFEGKLMLKALNNASLDFGNCLPGGDVFFDGKGTWKLISNLITRNNAGIILKSGSLELTNTAIISKRMLKSGDEKFNLFLNQALLSIDGLVSTKNSLWIHQQESQLFFPLHQPGFDELNREHSGGLKLIDNRTKQAMPVTVSEIQNCTCNGDKDGSAKVTFSGAGSGPYTIQWLSTTPNTFNNVTSSPFVCTGLSANTYVIRIIGSTGTIVQTANVVIGQPSQIVIGITNTLSPLCQGDCNGKIVYNIIGGNPPYAANWNPGNITHSGLQQSFDDSISALCANTYSISINDSKGCKGTDEVVLTQPNAIVANDGKLDQQCFGECKGKAWLAPSGGTPFDSEQSGGLFYTISWNGDSFLTNDSLYNLCPGTVSYLIKDANNCSLPGSLTIAAKTDFTVTKSTPANLLCNDVCDGTANITGVSGATPPYVFNWIGSGTPVVSGTATTSTATALCSGTYSVVISDAFGCDDTTTFNLTAPPTLIGSVTKTDVSCFAGNNGTATGSQSGGSGTSFSFNWYNSTTNKVSSGIPFSTSNPSVSNLTAGNYTLVIIDQNGCNDTVPFSISEPEKMALSTTKINPTCFGLSNGQICGNVTGGTGTITYSFLPLGKTQSSNCYQLLNAGTYTVTATDANLCAVSSTVTLSSPSQINPRINKTNPSCNTSCNGSAVANPTGGSGSGYTYLWSCTGTTTASITGRCAGTCTLTVTDGAGCSQNTNVSFVAPNPLSATLNATSLSCSGSSNAQITSSVTGGTPSYTYSWSPGGKTTPGLSNVGEGTYSVTVKDNKLCTTTASITLTAPLPISISNTSTNPACFGASTGSILTTISGGTAPYNGNWLPLNSANFNQNNLTAGTYILNINDALGCTSSKTVTLTQPQPIIVSTDSTQTSCLGSCNGTASATASGGNGSFTYTWNTTPVQNTSVASNLCTGTYIVTTTDALGCKGTDAVQITEPTALNLLVNSITSSCANVCTGTANLLPSGGTAPYTFELNGNAIGSQTALSALCPGTHTVIVKDANNCKFTGTFIVPSLINITLTTSITTLTCSGDCNGSATASVSGAVGNPIFEWQPTGKTTQQVTDLCAGDYTVTVTDANGCKASNIVSFVNPQVLIVTDVSFDVDCNGNCSGSSTLSPTGGVAPYLITWSNGNAGPSISNLCIGNYTANITDQNGCSLNKTISITQPDAFTVTSSITLPSDCNASDGLISLNPVGGSGSFSYSWSPVAGTSSTLNGLSSGIYYVTITDLIYGCDTVLPFTISDPNGPVVQLSTKDATCNGMCNGSATVDVLSSNGPAIVRFSQGSTGSPPFSQTNLCENNYTVEIKDASNCKTYQSFAIQAPDDFIPNQTIKHASCSSGIDGSITLSPSGGTRPFLYLINGTPDDSLITNLSAGQYKIIVSDVNTCVDTLNYIITEPTAIVATETHKNINCTTGFGSATVLPMGGLLPYQFSWSSGAGNVQTVNNLSIGTHTCTITDANACTYSLSISIAQNPDIQINLTKADNLCNTGCSGIASVNPEGGSGNFSILWSHTSSDSTTQKAICPGDYSVSVTDDNGCTSSLNYSVNVPDPIAVTYVKTSPNCKDENNGKIVATATGGTAPISYSWSPILNTTQTAVNLKAGTYTLTLVDNNGCQQTDIVTVDEPDLLLVNANTNSPSCFGQCDGLIYSLTKGGTAPYTYQWYPTNISLNNDSISNLCSGSYAITITDANGCKDSVNLQLTDPPQVNLSASTSAASCNAVPCNGAITINSVSGTAVTWLNASIPNYTGLSLTDLCAGFYDIEVQDANACRDTFTIELTNSNGPLVNVDSIDVTCPSSCNGSLAVVSVTGNGPYTYSWSPNIATKDSLVSGLCSGTYVSEVTDANGCVTFNTISVQQPITFDDQEFITNALCNGVNNGSIILNPTGGTGTLHYKWSNNAQLDSPVNNGLAPGTYSVTITDANNCTYPFTYTVGASIQITHELSLKNPSCFLSCNGTATINSISGGTPPFTVNWSNGQSGLSAVDLCADLYQITITDNNGCYQTIDTALSQPQALDANKTVTNTSCGLCDGTISLSPTGGNGSYSYLWANGQTTSSIDKLCAGVYHVDVYDSKACKSELTITVNNIDGPIIKSNKNDILCSGSCTGNISLSITGGTAPFSYNWLGLNQFTSNVDSLCAGDYIVQVKDANNCLTNETITITETNILEVYSIITPATCGSANGSISINPSGGKAPYTLNWSNTLPSQLTQTNLAAGIYSLVLTDANACSDTFHLTLSNNKGPSVSVATDSVSCYGQKDGEATLTITGTNAPFSVLWNNGSIANPTLNELSAGNYLVMVTDAIGCTTIKEVKILEPSPFSLSFASSISPSCESVCNGSLTALANGGTLPYFYLWDVGNKTSSSINGLCEGEYHLTATDKQGCKATQTIILNADVTAFTIDTLIKSPSCKLCDGTIDMTVSGGSAPYQYTWSTGASSEDISSVCAGIYQVAISDKDGCGQTLNFAISNASGISSVAIDKQDESCSGKGDGKASVNPSGGTPGYTYFWPHNNGITNSQTDLKTGSYFVQITDANQCTRTESISINSPNEIVVSQQLVSPDCNQNNGSISLNVSGGTGALSYVWNPSVAGNTNVANGLSAGSYDVTITDSLNCQQQFTINLSNTNAPEVAVIDSSVTCYGKCDGKLMLSITHPKPTLTLWSNGDTSNTISKLCQGIYTAIVTDTLSKCKTIISKTVSQPDSLKVTTIIKFDPLCSGTCSGAISIFASGGTLPYAYQWNLSKEINYTADSLCSGIYAISINDKNNCKVFKQVDLKEQTQIISEGTITNASCNSVPNGAIDVNVSGGNPGYTYQWIEGSNDTTQDLSNVYFGNYTLVIKDSLLCADTIKFTIGTTDTVLADAGIDATYCEGTPFSLSGIKSTTNNGILTYQWIEASESKYIGDSVLVKPIQKAGTQNYLLIVQNTTACRDTDSVSVKINPLPFVDAGQDQDIFEGQTATLGGNPLTTSSSLIKWVPNVSISNDSTPNPITTTTVNVSYTVTVLDTVTGCIAKDSIIIKVSPQIVISNGISPNGDGKNDFWSIDLIYKFPDNEVEIYNRWGELLYYKKRYDNSWDGTFKGNYLPVGTYYYVIKLNDPKFPDVLTGPITIFK